MIEVRVRFWTNNLTGAQSGTVLPKHAWDSGVVLMTRNPTHKIKPKSPTPFHSTMDLGRAIESVLTQHGIRLHPGGRSKKLIAP